MKILLTGFEPFGEHSLNASQKLLESLPGSLMDGVQLKKQILPVDKELAPQRIAALLHLEKPEAIIAFGLASGRPCISLERVAINLMDFRIPDNAGRKIEDQPVVEGGPAAYFTTLPIRSIRAALEEAGIPAELSLSAGAFLCNAVFYRVMHEIAISQLSVKAGFIHLPDLPEGAAGCEKPRPSMSLDLILKAAKLIITCVIEEMSLNNMT